MQDVIVKMGIFKLLSDGLYVVLSQYQGAVVGREKKTLVSFVGLEDELNRYTLELMSSVQANLVRLSFVKGHWEISSFFTRAISGAKPLTSGVAQEWGVFGISYSENTLRVTGDFELMVRRLRGFEYVQYGRRCYLIDSNDETALRGGLVLSAMLRKGDLSSNKRYLPAVVDRNLYDWIRRPARVTA